MNTAVIKTEWVGQVVDGRFLLLQWLGGTEQGSVFRTELQGPQPRRAAIRLIAVDAENAKAQTDRYTKLASLSHPHLMPILYAGRCQIDGVNLLYVVTEYAEESLAQVIPDRPLTSDEARDMLFPVLEALSYLHGQGIVYGRFKPANVMVAEDELKLPLDNLGASIEPKDQQARLRIYDAPEIAHGALSPAADMWSVGVTLVEALTQHPPLWDRSTTRDAVVPASVPQPFTDIARGCLRYESGKRLTLREIKNLLDSSPAIAPPAAAPSAPMPAAVAAPAVEARAGGPLNWRRGLMVGAGIAVLAVIVFLLVRTQKSQPLPPKEAQSSEPAVSAPAAAAPSAAAPAAPSGASPSAPRTSPAHSGTAKGEVAERAMPNVPESAYRTIHGKIDVRVRVAVDATGAVSNATFDARGHSPYFAGKALEAARRWRFKPAQLNGQAVTSVWILRFGFRRSGAEVTSLEVSP